jgi:hypothetical protein
MLGRCQAHDLAMPKRHMEIIVVGQEFVIGDFNETRRRGGLQVEKETCVVFTKYCANRLVNR